MKNRMRESCTFGSVRGEGSNVLTYSDTTAALRLLLCAPEPERWAQLESSPRCHRSNASPETPEVNM